VLRKLQRSHASQGGACRSNGTSDARRGSPKSSGDRSPALQRTIPL
jgi:hypothetical protein